MRHKITTITLVVAFTVIVLGAFTRLSDAGLGCPDWPGCYGQIGVPTTEAELQQAQTLYPNAPVEAGKAWTEMVHRYFASSLGLLILIIGFLSFKAPDARPKEKKLCFGLIAMVIFQGLLGMWTVTLKLFPLVVMGHLIGGIATLSLLWALWHVQKGTPHLFPQQMRMQTKSSPHSWIIFSIVLLLVQILLGGWTSANYAALSCLNFPECNEVFLPRFDLQAFDFIGALHAEVPSQYLSLEARQTVHMLHRIGALVVTLVLIGLHVMLIRFKKASGFNHITRTNALMISLLLVQIALGVTNVLALLPLPVAVMHNAVAILLMLVLIRLAFITPRKAAL